MLDSALGDLDLGLGCENATSYPAPGQLLLHPGATEGLCFVACGTAARLTHRGTVGRVLLGVPR